MTRLNRRTARLSVALPTVVMSFLVFAGTAFAGGGNFGG